MGGTHTCRDDGIIFNIDSHSFMAERRRGMKELLVMCGMMGLVLIGLIIGVVVMEDESDE